jgi:hypothetical protein
MDTDKRLKVSLEIDPNYNLTEKFKEYREIQDNMDKLEDLFMNYGLIPKFQQLEIEDKFTDLMNEFIEEQDGN